MRRLLLILTALLIVLLGGCAPKPEPPQLSGEEYMRVKRGFSENTWKYNKLIGIAMRLGWLGYISNDLYAYVGMLDIKTGLAREAKRVCKANGVRFEDFNKAHERFSEFGWPYIKEVDYYAFCFRREIGSSGGLVPYSNYDYILDRDLGIREDDRFLVRVDKGGTTYSDGEVIDLEEILWKPLCWDVYLIFDPKATARVLFETVKRVPDSLRLIVSDTFCASLDLLGQVEVYREGASHIDSIINDTNLITIVKIDGSNQVKVNGEAIDSPEGLASKTGQLMSRERDLCGSRGYMVISVDDGAECGKLTEVIRTLKRRYLQYVIIVPERRIKPRPKVDLQGYEPWGRIRVVGYDAAWKGCLDDYKTRYLRGDLIWFLSFLLFLFLFCILVL